MSEEFIEHLNQAVLTLNYGDRSKFIREAILEKLNREGVTTNAKLAAAPPRIGKRKPEAAISKISPKR
jgi:hypothetical protein